MQRRTPAAELSAVRMAPEAADQAEDEQRLQCPEARFGRALERVDHDASEPQARAFRSVELIDANLRSLHVARRIGQEMPQHAIGQPGLVAGSGRQALERDRQLVQHLVAALVGARRRTARPDEPPGEEIGQTRVALPVRDERSQDLRPREEGTVGRRDAADRQSATTTGRKAPAVIGRHALRAQTEGPGFLVRGAERTLQLVPVVCLRKVQAQDTGVRLEQETAQARVLRRRVPFERDGELQRLGRDLDRCDEVEVVLEVRDGWQKTNSPPARASTHRAVRGG